MFKDKVKWKPLFFSWSWCCMTILGGWGHLSLWVWPQLRQHSQHARGRGNKKGNLVLGYSFGGKCWVYGAVYVLRLRRLSILYPEWSEPEVFQICDFQILEYLCTLPRLRRLKKIPKSEMLQNPRPFNNYLKNLVWGCSTCNIMLKVCLYPRKTMNFVCRYFSYYFLTISCPSARERCWWIFFFSFVPEIPS